MTSQKEFDVMISYNTESGTKYMEKLCKKLKSKGYKVWVYIDQMYDNIYDGMARGVAGAYILIALISEAYKESTNCMLELKQAQKLNKVIIPVKIENYTPPEDSSMSFILNDLVYYKVYGKFDETAKLIDAVEKQLGICKSVALESKKENDVSTGVPQIDAEKPAGTEDQNSSFGSFHHPEDEEQALTDGMGSLNLTSEDEGQLDASHILNDRALLLKMANMLEPSNALEQLAMSFNFTAGEITQIMHGSKPTQYFFTNLASREGSIKLSDLKNLIEGDELQTKKITIFPRIITDINNERVRFTLESTLAEIASDGEHWLYFLENVANELPSNGFGINSWEDVAGYYKYTQIEINNFRMRHSDTQRPTEVFFEILSHKEHVPTISTVKENLKQRQRYDVIRVIDAWLQKPKN